MKMSEGLVRSEIQVANHARFERAPHDRQEPFLAVELSEPARIVPRFGVMALIFVLAARTNFSTVKVANAVSDESRWGGYAPPVVMVLLLLAALSIGLTIQLLVLRHHWLQSLRKEAAES